MRRYYIYTLKLEDNRYYVGATSNLTRRFRQHRSGKGANYTKLYKPLRIISYIEVMAESFTEVVIYEDARALEVIFEFGIDRARGGRFFSPRTKKSKLRKNYDQIPANFKNMPQVKSGAVSLAESNRPNTKSKRKNDVWAKQVAKAKFQLELSRRRLSA